LIFTNFCVLFVAQMMQRQWIWG